MQMLCRQTRIKVMPLEPQNFVAGIIVGVIFTCIVIGVIVLLTFDMLALLRPRKQLSRIDDVFDIGKDGIVRANVIVAGGSMVMVKASPGHHTISGGSPEEGAWIKIWNDKEEKEWEATLG